MPGEGINCLSLPASLWLIEKSKFSSTIFGAVLLQVHKGIVQNMKSFLLALIVGLLSASSSYAAEVLRVGMSADYPPLHFKQGERVLGIEPDNARAVAKLLGRPLSFSVYPFDELFDALQNDRVDVIMSGISVTEARSKQMLFTDPYLRIGQMAILHEDKVGSFSQPRAMYRKGARIGVEPGTTGEAFAHSELPDAVVVAVANPEAGFEALRADKIDLYIHDAPTSWRLSNRGDTSDLISLYKLLTDETVAWAVKKSNRELAENLNKALEKMQENGSLDAILKRWIPVSATGK